MAKKTIKELEKEVARLQKELSEQIAENGILTEKYWLVNWELTWLKVQYKLLKQENKKLKDDNYKLELANEELLAKQTFIPQIEKERIKELEKENKRLKEKWTRCRVEMVKREMENKKIEEKYEQCFEELSTKLSEESDLDIIRAENEVIKQDKANLLAELTRQINEKSALRKENKRLKKRRREWRYNPKKVYEKLARWWLCYIPEWDYLPTKVHESLIDAMEEWHRLADKTWNQVYIVWTYCKI